MRTATIAKTNLRTLLAVLCAVWCGIAAQAQQAAPSVFAAASLREALEEIAGLYPQGAVLSVAGSGMIARQVAEGAPADVVVLANEAWMDWLVAQGHVDPARCAALLSNRLVLIGPEGAPDLDAVTAPALIARLGAGRLAVGQTLGVPAGIYARQWMQAAGLWTALRPHLAETDNVRAALALVARGEAPLGAVYATDAMADSGVRILYDVPAALHDPIVYPVAALTPEGDAFVAFLQGDAARAVFAAHGFLPPPGGL